MIYLGADYEGYNLKEFVKKYLDKKGLKYEDFGTFSSAIKNDFTDFIPPVVKKVKNSKKNFGILICGSGLGMSIGANRFKKIRAVLVFDEKQAIYSKTHDNANIICLSSWVINRSSVIKILNSWLKTNFKPLKRRVRRFKKIDQWPN